MDPAKLASDFLQALVPLFVAIDAPGVLPLYLNLTDELTVQQRRRVLAQAILAAFLVAMGFVLLGRAAFQLMGIEVSDFAVAGGLLVFVIATLDIVSGRKAARQTPLHGAVPLGTPLIVGPATLTTALLLGQQFGLALTVASIIVNLAIAWGLLRSGEVIERVIGRSGSQALSKVAGLILAAYGVMMVRRGVVEIIQAASCPTK
jgi:multiple antibiotic resistance protein